MAAYSEAPVVVAKALTCVEGTMEQLDNLLNGDYYGADADTLPAPVRRKARRAARAAADLKATIAALYEEMT